MRKYTPQTIGVDVSKARLDVRIADRGCHFPNTQEGVEALERVLTPGSVVCLEASGGYERLVTAHLRAGGHEVRVFNPRKIKRLGDSLGFSAKTDALDACLLAKAGEILPAPPTKSVHRTALCDLTRRLENVIKRSGMISKQLQSAGLPQGVTASLNRELSFIKEEIAALRNEALSLVKECGLSEQQTLLMSIPSIGIETARTLIAELPDDINAFTSNQISSYAGLAPMDDNSGTRTGRKHIRKGNSHIKRALYMAAINALGHRPEMKERYLSLRAKGKSHQLAIIAIMRRLLTQAVAVLKRGTKWEIRTLTP